MKKKIIPCILVVSLLFSIGCSSSHTIATEKLEAKPDITVFTKDSLEYEFLMDNYDIQGDTLIGFGEQRIGGRDERFHGSIALADIKTVVDNNHWVGGLEGFVYGFIPGAVLGVVASVASQDNKEVVFPWYAGAAFFGAITGITGGIIGLIVGHSYEYQFVNSTNSTKK